jgi:hypothetical protein
VHLEASFKPHVHQKFEKFWTNIASTMACPNFKNGPKNGLGPFGVNSTHTNCLIPQVQYWVICIDISMYDMPPKVNWWARYCSFSFVNPTKWKPLWPRPFFCLLRHQLLLKCDLLTTARAVGHTGQSTYLRFHVFTELL